MLSFQDGKPIARINGGKLNRKVIFVNDKDNKGFTSIEIPDKGILYPVPDIDGRQVVYIAGPSGSGKTTYSTNYIKEFHRIFPRNNIFVFSRLEKDPVLDKVNPKRILLDNSLIDDPIDIHKEFQEGDLILFDDCDTIQDKKLKDAISRLKNDILETGRHMCLYIIITSHLINGNDRKDTRTILNEAHSLTVFPKSGSAYGIKYVLKNYIGLSNDQIEEILSLPSRWVTIGKNYPQYVFYEKGAYLVN